MKMWGICLGRRIIRTITGDACVYAWKSEAEFNMDERQRHPDFEHKKLTVKRVEVRVLPSAKRRI